MLEDLLLALASDLSLVATDGADGARPTVPRSDQFSRLASYAAFQSAAEEDPDVSRIFRESPETLGVPRAYGREHLARQILKASTWHAWLAGDLSASGVRTCLAATISGLVEVIRTGELSATVLTGFTFSIPQGSSLETPWGRLRSRSPADDRFLIGLDNQKPPEGGSVLETPTKIRWRVTPDGAQGPEGRLPAYDRRECQLLALSVALAMGVNGRNSPVGWFCTRINPLSAGLPGGAFRWRWTSGPKIANDRLPELEDWFRRVAERPPADVPVHRTLSMLDRSVQHVDALIDAVIVWEALFGRGSHQELSWRISMNMAAVTSADPEARIALQKEIKDLYDKRSRIVHGELHLGPAEAHELRFRAQELTLGALIALLRDHPSLVNAKAKTFVAFLLGKEHR